MPLCQPQTGIVKAVFVAVDNKSLNLMKSDLTSSLDRSPS